MDIRMIYLDVSLFFFSSNVKRVNSRICAKKKERKKEKIGFCANHKSSMHLGQFFFFF